MLAELDQTTGKEIAEKYSPKSKKMKDLEHLLSLA
jgi:hypothetical protein